MEDKKQLKTILITSGSGLVGSRFMEVSIFNLGPVQESKLLDEIVRTLGSMEGRREVILKALEVPKEEQRKYLLGQVESTRALRASRV